MYYQKNDISSEAISCKLNHSSDSLTYIKIEIFKYSRTKQRCWNDRNCNDK